MIDALIFDLDGLLADTEGLHCRSYQQTLAEIGIELTDEEYAEHWIRNGGSITEFLKSKDKEYSPALRERKIEIYLKLVDECLTPMPGALDLLKNTYGNKRLALASSGFGAQVDYVLNKLSIKSYFEAVAYRENVKRLKPHPDIFLYAAEQLNVKPDNCLVFEDAEKGILAAHAAGMKSIAVPNKFTRNNDFSKATLVLDSLEDVSSGMINAL